MERGSSFGAIVELKHQEEIKLHPSRDSTSEPSLPLSRTIDRWQGLNNLEAKMRLHGLEVAVIVQQDVTTFDAEGADDDVGGFSDRDAERPHSRYVGTRPTKPDHR